jgi:hypothetical protein
MIVNSDYFTLSLIVFFRIIFNKGFDISKQKSRKKNYPNSNFYNSDKKSKYFYSYIWLLTINPMNKKHYKNFYPSKYIYFNNGFT